MTGILENSRRRAQPAGGGRRGEGKPALGALGQEAHLRPRAGRHLQPSLQAVGRPAAGVLVKGRAVEGRTRPLRQERDLAQAVNITQSMESHIEAYAPLAPARSTAISTARCSTCSRAAATTCTTAAIFRGRPATS